MKAATETLDHIVVKRRRPMKYRRQNLCLDKGYDFPEKERFSKEGTCSTSAIEERRKKRRYKRRRRWVVERTNSRHNRFRKLLVRYEKKWENYLGLVQLVCCIIVYRRLILG